MASETETDNLSQRYSLGLVIGSVSMSSPSSSLLILISLYFMNKSSFLRDKRQRSNGNLELYNITAKWQCLSALLASFSSIYCFDYPSE